MDFSSLQKKFSDSETFLSLLPHTPEWGPSGIAATLACMASSPKMTVTGLVPNERKMMIEENDSVGKHSNYGFGYHIRFYLTRLNFPVF
jgi:hypothetical protein